MALSDTRIQALKRKPQRYEVADDGGLFIEVQPSGAKVETCRMPGVEPVPRERADGLIAEWTEGLNGRPEPTTH